MNRIRESKVRIHKEADDMPTGKLSIDEAENLMEEKTWPLNSEAKRPKSLDLSKVNFACLFMLTSSILLMLQFQYHLVVLFASMLEY
jgi:hypothetical protein